MDDFEPRRGKQVVGDLDQLRAFLDAATVGYLGVCREGEPYVVPVNFARDGETIFIHSATTGKKVAFLEANPQVCFCVVPRAVQVEGKGAFSFDSVLVYGRAEFVADREAKRRAYLTLIDKYEPILRETLGEKCIDGSAIIAIRIEKMTGKRGSPDG